MSHSQVDTAHQFGTVLRRRRAAAGLTQEALAAAANLHPTYISLLENGHRVPTLDVVRRLATALGTTMTDVVAEVEGVTEPERGRRKGRERTS